MMSVRRRVRIILGLFFMLLVTFLLILDPYSAIFPADASVQFSRLMYPTDNMTTNRLRSGRKFIGGHNILCPSEPATRKRKKTLGIWVSSARSHFDRRNLIRRTWGSIKNYAGWSIAPLLFVIGSHGDDEDGDFQQKIKNEQEKFGDLLIGNFRDIYDSLTLKSTLAYEFFAENCPGLQILVKVDDDVFINIFQLTRALNEEMPGITQNDPSNIYCYVHHRSKPYRRRWDKWFVSEKEYPEKYYPSYCNGPAYLVTMGAVKKLTKVLLTIKLDDYFRMEDVFTTGILPSKFNQNFEQTYDPNDDAQEGKIHKVNKKDDWYFGPVTLTGGSFEELRKWARNEWFDPTNKVNCDYRRKMNSELTYEAKKYYVSIVFFVLDSLQSNFLTDFDLLWTKVRSIEGLQ